MSDEELIKETMMLDYSQLVMNNVYCHKEIKRLNNIIKELEKEFDKELESLDYREEKLYTQGIHDTIIDHKYLLQELKGSDKE